MKKLVSIFIGLIIVVFTGTSVSAADYEVKKGDSLWKIANENNTTVEALFNINDLKSSLIHPKQIIKLREEEPEYYIVKEGDTLEEISLAYEDVSVENMKEWNDLSSDLIITGQKLLVNNAESNGKSEEGQLEKIESQEKEVVEQANKESNIETAEATKQETTTQQINETTFSVEATAYTAGCDGCSGITATGINLNNNPYAKVIAVDPNLIPLGSKVYVEGYGYAVAGDTGGAIKGHKIDVHLPTKEEAYNWGRRTVEITLIE